MFVLYALPVAALALLAGRFARLWLSGYPGWLKVVGIVLAVSFALAEIIRGDELMFEPVQTMALLGPPMLLWYLIKLWSRRAQWERRRLRRLFVALIVGYLLTLQMWHVAGDGLMWLVWGMELELPLAKVDGPAGASPGCLLLAGLLRSRWRELPLGKSRVPLGLDVPRDSRPGLLGRWALRVPYCLTRRHHGAPLRPAPLQPPRP